VTSCSQSNIYSRTRKDEETWDRLRNCYMAARILEPSYLSTKCCRHQHWSFLTISQLDNGRTLDLEHKNICEEKCRAFYSTKYLWLSKILCILYLESTLLPGYKSITEENMALQLTALCHIFNVNISQFYILIKLLRVLAK
jgi:hypothetical protein